MERFGRIDVLVNNAGILRSTRAADVTPEEWHLVVDANLTGSFLCAQAAYPALRDSGHGRIVNMASMAGRATSTLGGVHYTTAKAGVLGLTRHLAREWARDGITVNAISPGIVDTPMVRGSTDEARMAQVLASIPIGRLAEPVRDRGARLLPRVRRGGVHHRRQRRHPRRRADHRLTPPRASPGLAERRARTTTDGPGSAVARAIAAGRSATSSTRSAGTPNERANATRSGLTRSVA